MRISLTYFFLILTKFYITDKVLVSDRSINKKQPILTNKKDFYEKCTALCCYHAGGEKLAQLCKKICTALRCYHAGGEKLAQLCATITLWVIFNVLKQMPEITAGDGNVLECQMTSRCTRVAAESP
jgi:hypothetical protein